MNNLDTALKINTHTQTRNPANAWLTTANSAKLEINAAIIVIINTLGNTTPSVEQILPNVPNCFNPTNVATLTSPS